MTYQAQYKSKFHVPIRCSTPTYISSPSGLSISTSCGIRTFFRSSSFFCIALGSLFTGLDRKDIPGWVFTFNLIHHHPSIKAPHIPSTVVQFRKTSIQTIITTTLPTMSSKPTPKELSGHLKQRRILIILHAAIVSLGLHTLDASFLDEFNIKRQPFALNKAS